MLSLLLIAAPVPGTAAAQGAGQLDVFVVTDTATRTSRILFLDALSGLSTVINVEGGHRFELVGDYVLYEKINTGAIMRANFDGTQEPHPFIRRTVDTQAVSWVVAPNRQAIGWVLVDSAGVSSAFVARADGGDLRQLPIASPAAPLTLAPLALVNDMTQFFYDAAHVPGTDYLVYGQVALYSIVQEQFFALPNEPGCACGAAVSSDGRIFARLEGASGDNGPFALHLWDLPTSASTLIPAPDNLPYRLGGDLLINRSGTIAVYGVAAGVGSEDNLLAESYGLVLVDLMAQRQLLIVQSGAERYRPVAFIDEDRALLLTGAGGTYKLDFASRELRQVSQAVYLGTLMLLPSGM